MELMHYTEELQRQLVSAAAAGTDDTRETAERLATALDAATRLVLVEALSEAAGEITRELAPGSVDLRVRGRDVDFVVTRPEGDPPGDTEAEPAVAPAMAEPGGDDPTSRATLRLPDALKQRAELAAAAEGVSLNTWLVRAVAAAVSPGPQSRRGRSAASYQGWVR